MVKKSNKYKPTIKDWPEDERPRERLIKQGSDNLSDTELLAIILRTGEWHEGDSAIDLGRKLIVRFGSLRQLDSASISELSQIRGIGVLKAAEIKAALEIGKRLIKQKSESKKKVESSEDVVNYYAPYLRDLKKEVFKVMLLDGRNKLISDLTISEGGLNSSTVDTKVVLKESVKESASALIFVHNHPSGESEPTEADIRITNHLIQACELVGLKVLDHIIIGNDNYTSFLEKGLIKRD
jgi:DNA repair protein RadC